MKQEFRMPDPGEGLQEADVVEWHVGVGDRVAVNDVVVEVETSKSIVELPSPYAGTVVALVAAQGETVEVGAPLLVVDDGVAGPDGSEPEAPVDTGESSPAPASPASAPPTPTLVGYGAAPAATTRRARRGSEPVDAPQAPAPQAPAAPAARAKPLVRRLARDLGVDLDQISGTGSGGIVTVDDVVGAASARSGRTPARDQRYPIKGVRKATAQAMVASAFTAPHVTEWVTLDVTETMLFLDRLRRHRDFRDVRLSPTTIAARAVCLALARHPALNAAWDDAAQEIVHKADVNLGIATATARGLVVPNIKAANRLSLVELATALNELIATGRSGRTSPADMSHGSFTLTNVGVFGVDAGTPILNPGESGILCLGAIERRPWVVDGGRPTERIEPRWVTTLAVSFDHRIVDGEQGSLFLADVAGLLRDPATGLL